MTGHVDMAVFGSYHFLLRYEIRPYFSRKAAELVSSNELRGLVDGFLAFEVIAEVPVSMFGHS